MELMIPISYLGWPNVLVPVIVCLLLLWFYTTNDIDDDE